MQTQKTKTPIGNWNLQVSCMCVCACDGLAHRATDGHKFTRKRKRKRKTMTMCATYGRFYATRVRCQFFIILVRCVLRSLSFSVFFGFYTWSWLVWWSSHGNSLRIFQLLPKFVRARFFHSFALFDFCAAHKFGHLFSRAKHCDYFDTKIENLDYVNDHNAVDINCFCPIFFAVHFLDAASYMYIEKWRRKWARTITFWACHCHEIEAFVLLDGPQCFWPIFLANFVMFSRETANYTGHAVAMAL